MVICVLILFSDHLEWQYITVYDFIVQKYMDYLEIGTTAQEEAYA